MIESGSLGVRHSLCLTKLLKSGDFRQNNTSHPLGDNVFSRQTAHDDEVAVWALCSLRRLQINVCPCTLLALVILAQRHKCMPMYVARSRNSCSAT